MNLPAPRTPESSERKSVVLRPLPVLVVLIAGCAAMGYAIYALIRSGAL